MATTTKGFSATGTWLCPPGVSSVIVRAYAGGGGGSGRTANGGGGGGGGGAFAGGTVPGTPGTTYTITVGTAGTAGANGAGGVGGNSWFNATSVVFAYGGRGGGTTNGGAGGTSGSCVGTPIYQGGGGGTGGSASNNIGGGGGGGAAGTGGVGGQGGNGGAGTTAGSSGTASPQGGGGGPGRGVSQGAGVVGTAPGGAGGGAFRSSSSQAGGAGAAGSVAIDFTTPSMGSLTDNFNDNSLNAALWNNWGGTNVTESGSALSVISGTASAYYGIVSFGSQTYDLTGTAFSAYVSTAGNQAIPSLEAYPAKLLVDASNDLQMMIGLGTVYARKKVATSVTALGSIAYNSTTMKWFRIREATGTTYWDYSQDTTNWTNLANAANPIAVTALYPMVQAGNSATVGTSGTVIFDNINTFTPYVVLNSPADASSTADTTPDLGFTGTDYEAQGIRYNVQVDYNNTFDSQTV